MQISTNIYNSLQNLGESLNNVLEKPYNIELERLLYALEKQRIEIYEQVRFYNKLDFSDKIGLIDNKYKATVKNDVLCLYIPEKLPTLKNPSSYAHKQIILNIAEVTKQYEKLFYNEFVIVIIKIFDKIKVWDVDNRTVKPIQDGLVYGGIIKDDNLFNCCYMVQGFYSDNPHIEVNVLKADKILKLINKNLPNITRWLWQNFRKFFKKIFAMVVSILFLLFSGKSLYLYFLLLSRVEVSYTQGYGTLYIGTICRMILG